MLISLFFIIAISIQLGQCVSEKRKTLAMLAMLVYLCVSSIDFAWLAYLENRPFHPSDPTNYHLEILGLHFGDVLKIESSNTFYFIVNWLYNKIWGNPYIISMFVKINNSLICVFTYLLVSKKVPKVTYIDFLILFNPYTIMTLVRNVRDLYIVLFVAAIIIGFGMIPNNRLNKTWTFVAVLLLSITRAVLLLPVGIVVWMKYRTFFSKKIQYLIYIIALALFVTFLPTIIAKVGNQAISALTEVGEDVEVFLPLLTGEIDMAIVKSAFIRLSVAAIVFFFTPHPYNFTHDWLMNMNEIGANNIYTGLDNFLISAGSIFSYLFVVPVILAYFINWKKANKYILVFVVCFSALYIISYMGVTDIRNRNTAIYFILLGIITNNQKLHVKYKHYVFAFIVFTLIYFISN